MLRWAGARPDCGERVLFGGEGWDDVPISRAVQASAALPGLYPPVEVRGRHLVDGALRRTMHASVLLDRGIDLLIGINPLVPFNAGLGDARGGRSEEHTSELQSLMRISYAVFCLKKKKA